MPKATRSVLDLIKDALEVRFLAKVNKNGPLSRHRPELGPCWPRGKPGTSGYGVFGVAGKTIGAHRVAYELWVKPIPGGMEIDHLCHPGDGSCPPETCLHRICVNPAHLEAVTGTENKRRSNCISSQGARRTRCIRGHEFTPENTRIRIGRSGNETRACKECERIADPPTGKPNVAEANAVKTHCPAGHEYSKENTAIESTGARRCRACRREQQQRANRKSREKQKRLSGAAHVQ